MPSPPEPRRRSGRDPAPAAPQRGGERKGFLLRLPPALLSELRTWANAEVRSLNGHIEFLLRQAVRRRRGGRERDGAGD